MRIGSAQASQTVEVVGLVPVRVSLQAPGQVAIGETITLTGKVVVDPNISSGLANYYGISGGSPLEGVNVYFQAYAPNGTRVVDDRGKTNREGIASKDIEMIGPAGHTVGSWRMVFGNGEQSLSPITIEAAETEITTEVTEEGPTPPPPGLPDTQSECEAQGYYWYNNACHREPEGEGIGMGIILLGAIVLLMAEEK